MIPRPLLYVNTKTYIPSEPLVQTDRMSMAHSSRPAALSGSELISLQRIFHHIQIRGSPPNILKQALEISFQPSIARRNRLWSAHRRWFRLTLRLLRDVLLDPRLDAWYYNAATLVRRATSAKVGKRDYSHIWGVTHV